MQRAAGLERGFRETNDKSALPRGSWHFSFGLLPFSVLRLALPMASDDWPALDVALVAAPGAEREHLWRRAVFTAPWLAQWLYSAAQLARARAHLTDAAARPPQVFPGVIQIGSWHRWRLTHQGSQYSGSAPTVREAALARDDEMRRLGVDKKYWTFSYDGVLPVLNQARVPRGKAGVNFELHAAAGCLRRAAWTARTRAAARTPLSSGTRQSWRCANSGAHPQAGRTKPPQP